MQATSMIYVCVIQILAAIYIKQHFNQSSYNGRFQTNKDIFYFLFFFTEFPYFSNNILGITKSYFSHKLGRSTVDRPMNRHLRLQGLIPATVPIGRKCLVIVCSLQPPKFVSQYHSNHCCNTYKATF